MTTIAYRDGVMAADSGSWMGDASFPWARKLVRGSDGTLYGVCGDAAQANGFIEWVEGGCSGERPAAEKTDQNGSSYLVLVAAPRSGRVKVLTARGIEAYEAPYFAIGAGNVGALCAMHAGASAEDAIRAAIVHAPGAEGPVQAIKHEETAP